MKKGASFPCSNITQSVITLHQMIMRVNTEHEFDFLIEIEFFWFSLESKEAKPTPRKLFPFPYHRSSNYRVHRFPVRLCLMTTLTGRKDGELSDSSLKRKQTDVDYKHVYQTNALCFFLKTLLMRMFLVKLMSLFLKCKHFIMEFIYWFSRNKHSDGDPWRTTQTT